MGDILHFFCRCRVAGWYNTGMSTALLNSKAFKTLLASEFVLPTANSCGWFFEQDTVQQAEFRALVRSFCALGATAVSLLAEAVEHQEITRKKLSKMVDSLDNLGFLFISAGDAFLEMPYRIRPSLMAEDVLLAFDGLMESLTPSTVATDNFSSALSL